jgi:hypothetical protein
MKPNYIPSDLTEKQTRLILSFAEKYGVGVAFRPEKLPSFTMFKLVDLGYLAKVRGATRAGYDFILTEKCQPVIDANN